MGEASKEREASTAKRVEVACILRMASCGLCDEVVEGW